MSEPICPCGLYSGQTCSRQPCWVAPITVEEARRFMQTALAPMPVYPRSLGCICPPGANKECENPACPRKPVRNAWGTSDV